MTELERTHLEDTYAILVDYDGNRTAEGLMNLIDEAMERIQKVLSGKVNKEDVGLYEQHMNLRDYLISESISDNHELLKKLTD